MRGLLLMSLLAAQANGDGDSLIAEAARNAKSATSWKVEGDTVRDGNTEHFGIVYRVAGLAQARLEITGGPNALVRYCDGTSQWTYYPGSNRYVRVILSEISPCTDPVSEWAGLASKLSSPKVVTGTDRVTVDGHLKECQKVRRTVAGTGSVVEVCIDRAPKQILRYQTEDRGGKIRTTILLTSVERDVAFDADVFLFRPPEGSQMVASVNWLDASVQSGAGVFRVSDEVSAPMLVSMVAPQLGLLRKSAGGLVVLYLEVNGEGVPQNIRVAPVSGSGFG